MKLNYKKLGQFIQIVDERNTDLSITNLQGVSISKEFMPSIANIIGTDLSVYKIVRTGQFAYGPVTSRNGDKISVALLKGKDCIISSSYTAFEIVDKSNLLPEYLMLWFCRPEFDRYARFMSHGSAREVFDWDRMCDVELPVPPIEEQRKIVHDFSIITDRIDLLNKINANLENQIISVFSKTFPNITNSGNTRIGDVAECVLGGTPSRDEPDYWGPGFPWINSGKVNDFRILSESEFITILGLKSSSTKIMPPHSIVLAITGATLGQESITLIECCANQSVVGIMENKDFPYQFIHPLVLCSMQELLKKQTGGAQSHICKDDVADITFNYPDKNRMDSFVKATTPLYDLVENQCWEIQKLSLLKDVILQNITRRKENAFV